MRGGRIIDPVAGIDTIGDVLIRDGHVVDCGAVTGVSVEGVRVLAAGGFIVSPGFVDLHTHLRFPGFPEKETMGSGTLAAAAGGFTTVCAMANTDPVVDSVEILRQVLAEAERDAVVRVRQLASISRNLTGRELSDLSALAGAGAVAFSDDGKPVEDAGLMKRALTAAARLN